MPFDGTNQSLAAKMREILKRGWCKKAMGDGAARCLMGAFMEARGRLRIDDDGDVLGCLFYDVRTENETAELIALSSAVATVSPHHKRLLDRGHWNRVAMFNNDPATSINDVMRVIDEFEKMEVAHVA